MKETSAKDIEEFFFDEENRKEYLDFMTTFNNQDSIYDETLLDLIPHLKNFREKSKLFYAYLWLAKTEMSAKDLPEIIKEALVPKLRISDKDKSGIRMGGLKRYEINTKDAFDLAREKYNDKDFEKWLANAFPSYTERTALVFFYYKEYFKFFNKKITPMVIVKILKSKEILEEIEKDQSFAYSQDILKYEEKNRFKILDQNINVFFNYLYNYKLKYLTEKEKRQIFDYVMTKLKEESKNDYSSEENSMAQTLALTIFNFFSCKMWEPLWEEYLNNNDFKPLNLGCVSLNHYSNIVFGEGKERDAEESKLYEQIDTFKKIEFMEKLGLGRPSEFFYKSKDMRGLTNKREKLKIIYQIESLPFTKETLRDHVIKQENNYNSSLSKGLWFYLLPFEFLVFFKKEFLNFTRKTDMGLILDKSANDFFIDYLLLSNEEFELTEDIKNFLILTYLY